MSILERLFGRGSNEAGQPPISDAARSADEQAIARYRYLLRTAPPEAIEQTHAEAFSRLTPEQRRMVLDALSSELPPAERNVLQTSGDSPQALARAATRSELRQPGSLERAFGRMGPTPGLGGMMVGTFLSTMAGAVLGTALAHTFMADHASDLSASDQSVNDAAADDGGQFMDASDSGGDFDAGDAGGIDV